MAEFLDALDLTDVTLVHSDWGGALFLTADGLDARVARMAILPCEAFDNVPPGLPGRVAALAARIPGGLRLGARQLRVRALRRSPLLLGQMARSELPDALVRSWTQPLLENPLIGRDVRAHARYRFDPATLTRKTEALSGFPGRVLVLWSSDDRVMPAEHGRRLASLIPRADYRVIDDAAVLSMMDQPRDVARHLGEFLLDRAPAPRSDD